MKKRVIIVTDGDEIAQEAVKRACKNEGLYPMLSSGGNPTPLSGSCISREIKQTPYDPVVVMLDDRGEVGAGKGEKALEHLLLDKDLEILGVIAVASNTSQVRGVKVDESVDYYGHIVGGPVDKNGNPEPKGHQLLEGDTSEILARYPEVKVVGCGDLGKMQGQDNPGHGAMITTKCIKELLRGKL